MKSDSSWYAEVKPTVSKHRSSSGEQTGRPPDVEMKEKKPDVKKLIDVVCLVDDEDDAEKAMNHFRDMTMKKIFLPLTGVEIQKEFKFLGAIRQFKMILEKKIEVLTLRKNLKEILYKYISFLGSNYGRIANLYKEQYWEVMEDILVIYCDVVMEFFRDQIRINKKPKVEQEARRIKILLRDCLLKKMDRILHVLLKVKLDPDIEQCKRLWSDVYLYFLTKVPCQLTNDDILRSFIAFQKFKTIRKQTEGSMIDQLMLNVYKKKSLDELKEIPCLADILDKRKKDRFYTIRDMLSHYMRYFKEKKSKECLGIELLCDEDESIKNSGQARRFDFSDLSSDTPSTSYGVNERRKKKNVLELDDVISALDRYDNEFSRLNGDVIMREDQTDSPVVVLDDEDDDDIIIVSDNLRSVITIDDGDSLSTEKLIRPLEAASTPMEKTSTGKVETALTPLEDTPVEAVPTSLNDTSTKRVETVPTPLKNTSENRVESVSVPVKDTSANRVGEVPTPLGDTSAKETTPMDDTSAKQIEAGPMPMETTPAEQVQEIDSPPGKMDVDRPEESYKSSDAKTMSMAPKENKLHLATRTSDLPKPKVVRQVMQVNNSLKITFNLSQTTEKNQLKEAPKNVSEVPPISLPCALADKTSVVSEHPLSTEKPPETSSLTQESDSAPVPLEDIATSEESKFCFVCYIVSDVPPSQSKETSSQEPKQETSSASVTQTEQSAKLLDFLTDQELDNDSCDDNVDNCSMDIDFEISDSVVNSTMNKEVDSSKTSKDTNCFSKLTEFINNSSNKLTEEDIQLPVAENVTPTLMEDLTSSSEHPAEIINVICHPIEPPKEEEITTSGVEAVTFTADEVVAPFGEGLAYFVHYPASSQEESQRFIVCDAPLGDEASLNNEASKNAEFVSPRSESVNETPSLSGSQPYTSQSSHNTGIKTLKQDFGNLGEGSSTVYLYLDNTGTGTPQVSKVPEDQQPVNVKSAAIEDSTSKNEQQREESGPNLIEQTSKLARVETDKIDRDKNAKISKVTVEDFRDVLSQSVTFARKITPQKVDKIAKLLFKYFQLLWNENSEQKTETTTKISPVPRVSPTHQEKPKLQPGKRRMSQEALSPIRSLKIYSKDIRGGAKDLSQPKDRDVAVCVRRSSVLQDPEPKNNVPKTSADHSNDLLFDNAIEDGPGNLKPNNHDNFLWSSVSDDDKTEDGGAFNGVINVKPDSQLYRAQDGLKSSRSAGAAVGGAVKRKVVFSEETKVKEMPSIKKVPASRWTAQADSGEIKTAQEKQTAYLDYSLNNFLSQSNFNVPVQQTVIPPPEISSDYYPNLNFPSLNSVYLSNDKLQSQNLEINPNLLHCEKNVSENTNNEAIATVSRSLEESPGVLAAQNYMFENTDEIPFLNFSTRLPDISTLRDFITNFMSNSELMPQTSATDVSRSSNLSVPVVGQLSQGVTQSNIAATQSVESACQLAAPTPRPGQSQTDSAPSQSRLYQEQCEGLSQPKLEGGTLRTLQESLQKTELPLKKRKLTKDEELAIYIQKFKEEKELKKKLEENISYPAQRQMSIADLQRDFPKVKSFVARKLYPEGTETSGSGSLRLPSIMNVYINGVREFSANYLPSLFDDGHRTHLQYEAEQRKSSAGQTSTRRCSRVTPGETETGQSGATAGEAPPAKRGRGRPRKNPNP